MLDHLILTLAQEDAPPIGIPTQGQPADGTPLTSQPDGTTRPAPQPGFPSSGIMFLLPAVLVIMIIFSMSSQRREKKKRDNMLAALKKGDKVQTIGGILGTTMEVRDEHVTLKIDENTNTRVKFSRSAIQSDLADKDE